jgi:hypothetical protein
MKVGDKVIYRKHRCKDKLSKNAINIRPSLKGESYSYDVDKFCKVKKVEDGIVTIVTRKGKEREIEVGSKDLRKANWLQRLIYRNRFYFEIK